MGALRLRFLALTFVFLGPCAQLRAAPATFTYVFVHGAWGGGWAYKEVDRLLTADGNKVYRPTLAGLGEKVHLSSPEIGLSTHIEDIVNVILWEDLHDVILVGHSYGGMVITGVADRVPSRIKKLIYLDAILPLNGESVNTAAGGVVALGLGLTSDYIPTPGDVSKKPLPHDEPMPAKTCNEPIVLSHPAEAARIPSLYVLFLPPGRALSQATFYAFYLRAQARGWPVSTFPSDHMAMVSHPRELVSLLERLAP